MSGEQTQNGSPASGVIRREPQAICGVHTNLFPWAKADGLCQLCGIRGRVPYWYKGKLFGDTPQPGYGDLALCNQCAGALRGCVEAASSFVRAVRADGGHRRRALKPRKRMSR